MPHERPKRFVPLPVRVLIVSQRFQLIRQIYENIHLPLSLRALIWRPLPKTPTPVELRLSAAEDVVIGVYKTAYQAVSENELYKDLSPSSINYNVTFMRDNPQIVARLEHKAAQLAAVRAEEAATAAKEAKNLEKQVAADCESLYHGVSREVYQEAFMEGVKLMTDKRKPLSKDKAAAAVKAKFPGLKITGEALRKHIASGKKGPPSLPGREPYLPNEALERLSDWIRAKRALKLRVFKCDVMRMMQALIDGTAVQALFKGGRVSDSHYYRFLKQYSSIFDNGKIKPEEIDRRHWDRAEIAEKHYDVVAEELVAAGIAEWNPNFNELDPHSERIIILAPQRMASLDETHVTLDMTKTADGRNLGLRAKADGDTGEAIANKGGGDATSIGGSRGDGHALKGLTIFKSATWLASWTDAIGEDGRRPPPACSTLRDETGKLREMEFTANKQGGYIYKNPEEDVGVIYMRRCLLPCMPADTSPQKPCVVIMDGYGGHLSLALVEFCREHGIVIVLRPPHTSHRLQGEDVVNFNYFKQAFDRERGTVFDRVVLGHRERHGLGLQHLSTCVKAPWEEAFSQERNLRAWRVTGYVPFTRCVMHERRAQEAMEEARVKASGAELNYEALRLGPTAPKARGTGGGGGMGEGGDDDEEEETETEQTSRARLRHSTHYWDRGSLTRNEAYEKIKKSTEDQQKDEADKEARKQRNEEAKKKAGERDLATSQEAQTTLLAAYVAIGGGRESDFAAALHEPGLAEQKLDKEGCVAMARVRQLDGSGKAKALVALRLRFPAPANAPPPPPPQQEKQREKEKKRKKQRQCSRSNSRLQRCRNSSRSNKRRRTPCRPKSKWTTRRSSLCLRTQNKRPHRKARGERNQRQRQRHQQVREPNGRLLQKAQRRGPANDPHNGHRRQEYNPRAPLPRKRERRNRHQNQGGRAQRQKAAAAAARAPDTSQNLRALRAGRGQRPHHRRNGGKGGLRAGGGGGANSRQRTETETATPVSARMPPYHVPSPRTSPHDHLVLSATKRRHII